MADNNSGQDSPLSQSSPWATAGGEPMQPAQTTAAQPAPTGQQASGIQPDAAYSPPASPATGYTYPAESGQTTEAGDPSDQSAYRVPDDPNAPPMTEALAALLGALHGGAKWFLWIAGLTAVNTLADMFGTNWRFIFGLGITQLFDGLGSELARQGAGWIRPAAWVLDGVVIGIYLLLGLQAGKGQVWAFIVGLVLFGLDMLLSLAFQDWVSVIAHIFAMFFIFQGMRAALEFARAARQPAMAYQPAPQQSAPTEPPGTPPPSQW